MGCECQGEDCDMIVANPGGWGPRRQRALRVRPSYRQVATTVGARDGHVLSWALERTLADE